jgi:hypothetical protein
MLPPNEELEPSFLRPHPFFATEPNSAITIDRAGQARINARGERQRSMKRERVSSTQLEPRRGGN